MERLRKHSDGAGEAKGGDGDGDANGAGGGAGGGGSGTTKAQKEALKAAFTQWMQSDEAAYKVQVEALVKRLSALADAGTADDLQLLLLRLSKQHEGDVGIFAPLLLNYMKLKPGEARAMKSTCDNENVRR